MLSNNTTESLGASIEQLRAFLAQKDGTEKAIEATRKKIDELWENNDLLRVWYSGRPIDFNDNQSSYASVIEHDELIKDFKCMLRKNYRVANSIWDTNKSLRNWYHQESFTKEHFNLFEVAAYGRCNHIIYGMWKNEALQQHIKTLNSILSETLLLKLLTHRPRSDFINSYLNNIDDIEIIRLALEATKTKRDTHVPPSETLEKRIHLLELHLRSREQSESTPPPTKKQKTEECLVAPEQSDLIFNQSACELFFGWLHNKEDDSNKLDTTEDVVTQSSDFAAEPIYSGTQQSWSAGFFRPESANSEKNEPCEYNAPNHGLR